LTAAKIRVRSSVCQKTWSRSVAEKLSKPIQTPLWRISSKSV
jgi:hypothetical protein